MEKKGKEVGADKGEGNTYHTPICIATKGTYSRDISVIGKHKA